MACGTHHACPCREDMLIDAVDALKELVHGIEDYKDSIAVIDRVKLGKFIYSLPSAKSVMNRSRRIS